MEEGSRTRLLFAAAAAGALAVVVVVVLIVSSGSGVDLPEPIAAPEECVSAWNDSNRAIAFGTHNFKAHAYVDVQVTRLSEEGTVVDDPEDPEAGLCAVLFARSTLDPEPGAAGEILDDSGRWDPLANRTGYDASKLTQLQSDAVRLANAELQFDGTIEAD